MTVGAMTPVDRALLVSEWAAGSRALGAIGGPRCPSCLTLRAAARANPHEPDCAHDLALCERGYPTQVERDRARELLAQADAPGSTP